MSIIRPAPQCSTWRPMRQAMWSAVPRYRRPALPWQDSPRPVKRRDGRADIEPPGSFVPVQPVHPASSKLCRANDLPGRATAEWRINSRHDEMWPPAILGKGRRIADRGESKIRRSDDTAKAVAARPRMLLDDFGLVVLV